MARVKINDDWFKELANPKNEDYIKHLAQIGGVNSEPTLEESIAGISKTLNDRNIDSVRKPRPNRTGHPGPITLRVAAFTLVFSTLTGCFVVSKSKDEQTTNDISPEDGIEQEWNLPYGVSKYLNEHPIKSFQDDIREYKFTPKDGKHSFTFEDLWLDLTSNGIKFDKDELISEIKYARNASIQGNSHVVSISGDFITLHIQEPVPLTSIKISLYEAYIHYLLSDDSIISQWAKHNVNINNYLYGNDIDSISEALSDINKARSNMNDDEYLAFLTKKLQELSDTLSRRYGEMTHEITLEEYIDAAIKEYNLAGVLNKNKDDNKIIEYVRDKTNYPLEDLKLVYKYVRDNPDALCYYETGRTLKIGASPDYYTFATIADMLNSQGIITDEINLVKDATSYAEGNTSAFKTQVGDPKFEGSMTYNATVMNEGVVQLKALYELYVEYILNDGDLKKSIATAQIIPGEEKSTLEQMLDDLQRKYEEIQKKYNTGPGRDCELIDAYIAELQEAIRSCTFSDGTLTISFDYFADLYIRLLAKELCKRCPHANYDIIYTTIRTRLDTAIEMFVPASPSFN